MESKKIEDMKKEILTNLVSEIGIDPSRIDEIKSKLEPLKTKEELDAFLLSLITTNQSKCSYV